MVLPKIGGHSGSGFPSTMITVIASCYKPLKQFWRSLLYVMVIVNFVLTLELTIGQWMAYWLIVISGRLFRSRVNDWSTYLFYVFAIVDIGITLERTIGEWVAFGLLYITGRFLICRRQVMSTRDMNGSADQTVAEEDNIPRVKHLWTYLLNVLTIVDIVLTLELTIGQWMVCGLLYITGQLLRSRPEVVSTRNMNCSADQRVAEEDNSPRVNDLWTLFLYVFTVVDIGLRLERTIGEWIAVSLLYITVRFFLCRQDVVSTEVDISVSVDQRLVEGDDLLFKEVSDNVHVIPQRNHHQLKELHRQKIRQSYPDFAGLPNLDSESEMTTNLANHQSSADTVIPSIDDTFENMVDISVNQRIPRRLFTPEVYEFWGSLLYTGVSLDTGIRTGLEITKHIVCSFPSILFQFFISRQEVMSIEERRTPEGVAQQVNGSQLSSEPILENDNRMTVLISKGLEKVLIDGNERFVFKKSDQSESVWAEVPQKGCDDIDRPEVHKPIEDQDQDDQDEFERELELHANPPLRDPSTQLSAEAPKKPFVESLRLAAADKDEALKKSIATLRVEESGRVAMSIQEMRRPEGVEQQSIGSQLNLDCAEDETLRIEAMEEGVHPIASEGLQTLATNNDIPSAKVQKQEVMSIQEMWRPEGVEQQSIGSQLNLDSAEDETLRIEAMEESVRRIAREGFQTLAVKHDKPSPKVQERMCRKLTSSLLFRSQGIKVYKFLGKGGEGFVFGGKSSDKRKLAIKLSIKKDQSLYKEYLLLQLLSHESVIQCFDLGHPFTSVVVMEFAKWDLQGFIKARWCASTPKVLMPLGLVRSFSLDIARGLEFVHSKGYVHNDIKPQNILIVVEDFNGLSGGSPQLFAKISDFGFAEKIVRNDGSIRKYDRGYGTVAYAAPECLVKRRKDARLSDIWAFGVIVYRMITYHSPFPDFTVEDKKDNIKVFDRVDLMLSHDLHSDLMNVGDISGEELIELQDIVKRLLNPKVSEREPMDVLVRHKWFDDKQKSEAYNGSRSVKTRNQNFCFK